MTDETRKKPEKKPPLPNPPWTDANSPYARFKEAEAKAMIHAVHADVPADTATHTDLGVSGATPKNGSDSTPVPRAGPRNRADTQIDELMYVVDSLRRSLEERGMWTESTDSSADRRYVTASDLLLTAKALFWRASWKSKKKDAEGTA